MQTESDAREQEPLLAQLQALAATRVEASAQAAFLVFLRHYYEAASPDALNQREPSALVDAALAHWRLAQQRQPGELRLQLLTPSVSEAFAVVDTCVDDIPFLVDSISTAVRGAGSSIDWLVHPVLRVRRDAAGAAQAFLPGESPEAAAESLVHIEFEPLAQPQAYVALEQELRRVLADLRLVVEDFDAMRARVDAVAEQLLTPPRGAAAEDFAEAREFLHWLRDGHFTFLACSETRAESGEGGRPHFVYRPEAALGLARAGRSLADPDALIAPKQELDRYADSGQLVVVTKANLRAPVRYPEYMDVVSIKQFREDGVLLGTCRFIGLLSGEAYQERPRHIPLIRRKAAYVMQRSRAPEDSHAGKQLRAILHQLPRDDLFQIGEDELYQLCMGIRALRDRHQLRLFMRRDRYGRFYSFLVFLPREKYSRELRDRIAAELMEICNGQSVERQVEFPRGFPARIHCIVRTPPGTQIALTAVEIEQRLLIATRSWRDQLRELLLRTPVGGNGRLQFVEAFPLSYAEANSPTEAAADLQYLLRLDESQPLLPRLQLDAEGQPAALKLYTWARPVELSEVMPTLENFGLRVIRQEPTAIAPPGGTVLWLQEFVIRAPVAAGLSPDALRSALETAFLKTWRGEAENDGLNRLVLAAGLDWRQVSALRMLTRYLLQTGLPFSQAYIEGLLAEHAALAQLLLRLFETRFDPRLGDERRRLDQIALGQAIDAALDQVASLDADRVLRAFLSVIRAGLRSNYFQPAADGSAKPWISLKLDPSRVPELPLPRPAYEIFVYAPEVEGVHLRGGRVARGGLRWSDRRQDFRTEVLGLMKAQRVKNAIIVPVGAKGGFVVKQGDPANREAWALQGIACYKTFLRGLLDLTDNLVGDQVLPPPEVVRHDGDDPYLVVAADKGTASFSDIANGIAADYGFWMGDAFASGGSAGYDHKKMGITARGAWESVSRHFRELDGRDLLQQDFTVVGIGDMSGDVFGNGMLLSRHIRLVAAFDHRHIFIDPDPDALTGYEERARLFALPRSSWADYDAALLSRGGGIWPRTLKSIPLSAEARQALACDKARLTPQELIAAILRAPVDLLWNGGIGTYVKAQAQGHIDVGDRANDAIRVNGRELRCKVVGEGGNLGFTQPGRVEYAMYGGPRPAAGIAGGRINTDAIDNAGGVHSSDREVNIKIPLNRLLRDGRLDRAVRDPLLAAQTDAVAAAVLRDNRMQSAALSLLERQAAERLDEHAALMRTLEREGLLDRRLEFLPDDDGLAERRRQSRGLTRPELAVLLAYSKISLFDAVLASRLPDDPAFERELLAYFPGPLLQHYRGHYAAHPLRREIIATGLVNETVNRMGIAFVHGTADDHDLPRADILRAWLAAVRIHDAAACWQAIEHCDPPLPAAQEYALTERVASLLRETTAWLARSQAGRSELLDPLVGRYAGAVHAIGMALPEALPPAYRDARDRSLQDLRQAGVPEPLALRIAQLRLLASAPDIADLLRESGLPLGEVIASYFQVGERFRLPWLQAAIAGLPAAGRWQLLARSQLHEDVCRAQRCVTAMVLAVDAAPAERPQRWLDANAGSVQAVLGRLSELQAGGVADFTALSVAVRQLGSLCR
ncbi:MAG TPA: NAD-glutamate dehydrogenase [Solimonas sp.]|nr:NAD-glutamate dehydrogenase [Solimonas sp.]